MLKLLVRLQHFHFKCSKFAVDFRTHVPYNVILQKIEASKTEQSKTKQNEAKRSNNKQNQEKNSLLFPA